MNMAKMAGAGPLIVIDTLVLGCTHYPFLRKAIRKLLGESITLIDTSEAVVRQLKRQMEANSIPQVNDQSRALTFVSSKDERSLLSMANDLILSDMSAYEIRAKLLGDIA